MEPKKDEVRELNERYDSLLATSDKYPEELTGRYDLEKDNDDLNKRFNELNERIVELVEKSSTAKRAYQEHCNKLDEGRSLLDQTEQVRMLKMPVGIDVEETERNIEHIQVMCHDLLITCAFNGERESQSARERKRLELWRGHVAAVVKAPGSRHSSSSFSLPYLCPPNSQ